MTANINTKRKNEKKNRINIFSPLGISDQVNPFGVDTAGDAILMDLIGGFFLKYSARGELKDNFFSIKIDHEKNTVELTQKETVFDSNGTEVNLHSICNSIRFGLQNGFHTNFNKNNLKINCELESKKIKLAFKKIPKSLNYLFSLPELTIQSKTPIEYHIKNPDHTNSKLCTGPYYPAGQHEENKYLFKLNKNYPKNLRANNAEEILYERYFSYSHNELMNNIDIEKHHFLYFFGYQLSLEDLNKLKELNYKIRIIPNQWLIYVGTNAKLNTQDTKKLLHEIEFARTNIIKEMPFVTSAYSLSSSDQLYSLTKKEYIETTEKLSYENIYKKIRRETNYNNKFIPGFSKISEYIISGFRDRVYNSNLEGSNTNEPSVHFRVLGMSTNEPLTAFSYLNSHYDGMKNTFTKNLIESTHYEENQDMYLSNIKELNKLLLESRRVFPIAHAHGVIAISPLLEENDEISSESYYQPWAYSFKN